MKKVVLLVAVALGLGATQINAQSVSGGVKADANLSNFVLSDFGSLESTMKVGAGIGGFLKVDICENFAIQPELSVLYNGSKLKLAGVETDYEYWGFEVPVYALAQFPNAGGNRFYFGVGPVFQCGFSAEAGDLDLFDDDISTPLQQERANLGAGVLVGYELSCGLQINASYKIGLLNSLKEPVGDAAMRPETVSLGVGFRF